MVFRVQLSVSSVQLEISSTVAARVVEVVHSAHVRRSERSRRTVCTLQHAGWLSCVRASKTKSGVPYEALSVASADRGAGASKHLLALVVDV